MMRKYQLIAALWALLFLAGCRAAEQAPVPPVGDVRLEVRTGEGGLWWVEGSATARQACSLLVLEIIFRKDGQRVAEVVSQYNNVRAGESLRIRELYTSDIYPDRASWQSRCL